MSEYLFNKTLAESRGISVQQMDAMNIVYKYLHALLKRPEMYCVDPKQAVEVLQGLEYTLQAMWGFGYSKEFHSYWFEIKGCTCPKLDNRDAFGGERRYLNLDCPYHGERFAVTWEDRRLV